MRWAKKSAWDRAQWHLWFAWYPVTTIGDNRAWLETVERRAVPAGYDYQWEYTLL